MIQRKVINYINYKGLYRWYKYIYLQIYLPIRESGVRHYYKDDFFKSIETSMKSEGIYSMCYQMKYSVCRILWNNSVFRFPWPLLWVKKEKKNRI